MSAGKNASGKDLRTPLKRALGLGSAKAGTGHFVLQRITAIAVALTGAYLLGLLFGVVRLDYQTAHAVVAEPFNAILLVAFLVAACWHAKLGVQVVIEDYLHSPLVAGAAHLANIFICSLAAIAGVLSVLRIVLGN